AVPQAATLTATDNCDANPVVSYKEVKSNISETCASNYTLTRTWTAKDACGNESSKSQVITVKDTTAPVLSEAPADLTAECSAVPQAATLTATDNCDANPVVSYKEVKSNISETCASNYTLTRTWTAKDACGNESSKSQVITVKDTTAPVLSEAPADLTAECSAVPEAATLTATDNCDANPMVSYKEVKSNISEVFASNYTLTRTWTAKDACGNESSKSQVITVKDTTAPVAPVLADVTGECSATATAPTTTDNCKETAITGTTNDPLTYNTQGTHIITWTFDDGNGNTTTATQKVIVKDVTAPVAPVLADVTGECSATATTPTTTDNCKETAITGTTNDPLTYNTQGTHIITWTFDDGNGNTTTATQKVIVKDVTAPVAPVLADVTGECSAT
ncbi:HYR-like domain-containing protein, partial [Flavobacterium undicola]|nr:hypothetical protein [Flavobacterium undicola]